MVDSYSVLLVEDDETTRATMRHLLNRCTPGARILEATCGEEAIPHLEQEPLDLVVSDHHMRALDGVALLEMVRRDRPGVARILVTGHADFDLARDAINRAGVHAFLQKPVTPEALERALATARERVAHERAQG